MIRITKVNHGLAERVEASSIEEAIAQFDVHTQFIIARCELDEEWIGLDQAVTAKNNRAANGAQLASAVSPTATIWAPKLVVAEGEGWRTFWMSQVMPFGQPQAMPTPGRLRRV